MDEMYEIYGSHDITIHPTLKGEHLAYLMRFCEIRHMKRDVALLENLSDPLRIMVGLPLGEEGEYYVAGERLRLESMDPTVLAHNSPPKTQPRLWCTWVPSPDGERLVWSSGRPERYCHEDEWLQYLQDHFFTPWGYELQGKPID